MSVVQPSETDAKGVLACARKRAVAIILTPIVVTVIWAIVAMLTSVPVKVPSAPAPRVGKPVPAFSFPLLSGGTSSLSDYRGKLLLINIWATWCPPCINEMPDLQNLYIQMKSKGAPFEILGISIDALGAESVKKWVERFGINFPILLDPRGTVKKLYQITGVPETFVVDPKGVLVRKFIGPLKWDGAAMIKFLNAILEGRKKPAS